MFSKGNVDKRPNIILLKHLNHFIAAQEHNLKSETIPFRKKKLLESGKEFSCFLKFQFIFLSYLPKQLSTGVTFQGNINHTSSPRTDRRDNI